MKFEPWPRDEAREFRVPGAVEIRLTFGVSGRAVRESLVYFTARGGSPAALATGIERLCPDDGWKLTAADLLDASRWYSNECYFYIVMLQKELLGDACFHYPADEIGGLSAFHKIYERGPMKFVPWGVDPETGKSVHDFSFGSLSAIARYVSNELRISLSEVIYLANRFLPDGYQMEERFFSYEVFWCSMELRAYLLEFFKIVSNRNEVVSEGIGRYGLRVRHLRFLATFPPSTFPFVMRLLARNASAVVETQVTHWSPGRADLRIQPTSNYKPEHYGSWASSVTKENLSLIVEHYRSLLQSMLSLDKPPQVVMESRGQNQGYMMHLTWPLLAHPTRYVPRLLAGLAGLFFPTVLSSVAAGGLVIGPGEVIMGIVCSALSWLALSLAEDRFDLRQRLYREGTSYEETIQELQQVTDDLMRERGKLEARIGERAGELEQANAQLLRLEQARTRFLERISRELHVPLSLILGPLESFMDGRYGDHIQADDPRIRDMHAQGLRLLKRVQDLLDVAQLQSGRLRMRARPIDLADMLAWCAAVARGWADERSIELRFDDRGGGLRAAIDREILEKVVFHLLSNAVRFTLPGGHVELQLEVIENLGQFLIRVKDNGIGIPQRDLSSIINAGADDSSPGGLGLSICRDFVALLGGAFSIDSHPDEGTSVEIRLPIGTVNESDTNLALDLEHTGEIEVSVRADGYFADVRAGNTAGDRNLLDRDIAATSSAGQRGGILLLIDDPDLRRFVGEVLSELGNINIAGSLNSALDDSRRTLPHILVGDLRISDPRTFMLLRGMRQDKELRSTAVMILGYSPNSGGAPPGWEQWVDEVQPLPFRPSELKSRVRRLLWRSMEQRFGLVGNVRPEPRDS